MHDLIASVLDLLAKILSAPLAALLTRRLARHAEPPALPALPPAKMRKRPRHR